MAAIDVKTGVYLPPYSLQKRLQYWLEPSPPDGEAALQKPLKCPLGYVGIHLTTGFASAEDWLDAIVTRIQLKIGRNRLNWTSRNTLFTDDTT